MFGRFLSGRGAVVAALFSSVAVVAAQAGPPAKPNVIVVLVDDLGYGDLGCYGQKKVATPNLDRMAAEGMRFTDFYAGAAVCAPARSALLTGQHTGHTPLRDLGRFAVREKADGEPPLPAEGPSLGRLMREAGYVTGCIGKWGMGSVTSTGAPKRQGFDFFVGYIGHGEAHEYFPKALWRGEEKEPLPEGTYAPDVFAQETTAFLERNKDRPFFLYLTPTIPHFKLQVPSLGEYENKSGWSQSSRTRAAMIARLDRDMGELLDQLKKLGLSEKTLVLFTSDNGPTDERNVDLGFFDSTGGLRGQKRDLYEGGIRVPLIAWWPGVIKPGSVSSQIAAAWDILPTLAALAGVKPPEGVDGISLLPILEGRETSIPRAPLYWELVQRGGKQAVRDGRWKAVRLDVNRNADSPIELYDLATDPRETRDVAKQHPDIVRRMDALMKAAHQPSPVFPLLPDERAAAGVPPTDPKSDNPNKK